MPATTQRSISQKFFLSIGGVDFGFLRSMEGGGISAEVIEEPSTGYFTKKHIGQPRYEDCLLEIGFSKTQAMDGWIRDFWTGQYTRRDITIFTLDSGMQVKSQRQFFNARLAEITIPALDASLKEPGYISLRVAPEYSRSTQLPGKLTIKSDYKVEPKVWIPSNFSLEIDGLDCTKVNKIDAFTVKQGEVTDDLGEGRDSRRQSQASRLEFPNLKITLAESSAQSWIDWYDDFVIRGNNGEDQEKDGCISFFGPARRSILAKMELSNLGIFRLTPEKVQTGVDQIRRLVAEVYCESMKFEFC